MSGMKMILNIVCVVEMEGIGMFLKIPGSETGWLEKQHPLFQA